MVGAYQGAILRAPREPGGGGSSRFSKKGAFAGTRANMEAAVPGQTRPWLKATRHMIVSATCYDFVSQDVIGATVYT